MTGERDLLLSALLVLVEAEGSINPLCALRLLGGGRCLRGLIAPRALLPSSVIMYTPPPSVFLLQVCLKYVVLANMLALSDINPFAAREAKV